MPDEHSESQTTNSISGNQIEPSSSRFIDDANSSCQNGQNTQGCTGCQSLRNELQKIKAELADSKQRFSSSDAELGKTDSVLEICNCRNEIHKLWIAVESINSQLKVPVKELTFEHELNQYKSKCATYEDKIKKMEEEKICLLESIRILSTESSAGSKVSTECAVNNKQESPGESITMDGNHERSTQGKRSKNNPMERRKRIPLGHQSLVSLQTLLRQEGVRKIQRKQFQ